MEYTIRRLGVGSVFKISFVLYGIIGLFLAFLYGVFFLFLSVLGSGFMGGEFDDLARFGAGLGVLAVFAGGIFFAAAYAVFCAAMTAVMAAVYNLLAAWVGGFRVTLDTAPLRAAAPAAPVSPAPPAAPVAPSGPPPSAASPGAPPPPPRPATDSYPPAAGHGRPGEDGEPENVAGPE